MNLKADPIRIQDYSEKKKLVFLFERKMQMGSGNQLT